MKILEKGAQLMHLASVSELTCVSQNTLASLEMEEFPGGVQFHRKNEEMKNNDRGILTPSFFI